MFFILPTPLACHLGQLVEGAETGGPPSTRRFNHNGYEERALLRAVNLHKAFMNTELLKK